MKYMNNFLCHITLTEWHRQIEMSTPSSSSNTEFNEIIFAYEQNYITSYYITKNRDYFYYKKKVLFQSNKYREK